MKKVLLRVLLPILLLTCAISLLLVQYPSKSFDSLLGTDDTKITKVFMINGSNGYSVETDDKGKIKELINLLSNRYYRKALNQEPRTGYNYSYKFFSGEEMILWITGSGSNIKVNGTYYGVSKSISPDSLGNWFASLSTTK